MIFLVVTFVSFPTLSFEPHFSSGAECSSKCLPPLVTHVVSSVFVFCFFYNLTAVGKPILILVL